MFYKMAPSFCRTVQYPNHSNVYKMFVFLGLGLNSLGNRMNEGTEYVTSQIHPNTFLTYSWLCSQLWCDCERNDHKGMEEIS